MGRLFDNNVANYMSRAAVNFGLNGATEISWGFWINITNVNAGAVQSVMAKAFISGSHTLITRIALNTTTFFFRIEQSAGGFPDWTTTVGIGTGKWTRVLFTWKRNAINANDGTVYVNGVPVSTTFNANSYAAGTAITEVSETLYYGINPFTLTAPMDAMFAWPSIWNRQLTAQEALNDAADPRSVTSGMIHQVQLCNDTDRTAFGNDMTVNGTLACADESLIIRTINPESHAKFPKMALVG